MPIGNLEISSIRREIKRSPTCSVLSVDICTLLDQLPKNVQFVVNCSVVQ